MSTTPEYTDTVILGAGPYGLAIASYLSFLEMDYRIIGQPMEFWRTHMKDNLQLRSTLEHTCPSNPDGFPLLSKWVEKNVRDIEKRALTTLYPDEFRCFMQFFSDHYQIPVVADHAERLEEMGEGFIDSLRSGKKLKARHVVVALGLGGMEHRPAWMAGLNGASGVCHSSELTDQEWRGKNVLIVGAGQSAAEIALQAVHGGAKSVEMAFRAKELIFNSMHSEFTAERRRRLFRVKQAYLYSGAEFRATKIGSLLPISIEPNLQQQLQSNVRLRCGSEVIRVENQKVGGVRVHFHSGSHDNYDRVVCATGYKPALPRLPLSLAFQNEIRRQGLLPDVSECAESTIDGLFFTGSWAAARFGPQSNFIYGSHQMVPRIVGRLARFDL